MNRFAWARRTLNALQHVATKRLNCSLFFFPMT